MLLAPTFLNAAESTPAPDFSTPEKALLQLEDAYRDHDIEAAIAAKDFRTQARLKLAAGSPEFAANEAKWAGTIDYGAKILEQAYRKALEDSGFPDFVNVSCRVTKKAPYAPNIVVLTEVCVYPGGELSEQRILVAIGESGWRVVKVVE